MYLVVYRRGMADGGPLWFCCAAGLRCGQASVPRSGIGNLCVIYVCPIPGLVVQNFGNGSRWFQRWPPLRFDLCELSTSCVCLMNMFFFCLSVLCVCVMKHIYCMNCYCRRDSRLDLSNQSHGTTRNCKLRCWTSWHWMLEATINDGLISDPCSVLCRLLPNYHHVHLHWTHTVINSRGMAKCLPGIFCRKWRIYVSVVACRLADTEPLTEPMLECC